MRVANATHAVSSSGIAEQNRFSIPLTGKIFDDIVDKRYSDKPRAIQRELATNGLDSHRPQGVRRARSKFIIRPSSRRTSLSAISGRE
jgi:hypothetical protein